MNYQVIMLLLLNALIWIPLIYVKVKRRFLNRGYDALKVEWFDYTFCNPPYGRGLLSRFVDKAIEQYKNGKEIIMLIPARTDTEYFHKLLECSMDIVFMKGRLKFLTIDGEEKGSSTFPSILIKLKPRSMLNVFVKTLEEVLR